MQPYFFPYVGYYDLINRVDQFVVFDTVKYTPQSWMNRNRILHPTSGWDYVTVPVERQSASGVVSGVTIANQKETHRRILAQIDHYRHSRAPFFDAVRQLIDRCFLELESDKLADLAVLSLRLTCEYLGIETTLRRLSQLALELPEIRHAGQWGLEVSAALGADEYVNAPGGRSLFEAADFASRGIALTFVDLIDYRYDCGRYAYVEHMSIIDTIMWNAPEAIKAFLDERKARAEGVVPLARPS